VPTYGPVITRGIDHNLLEDFRRDSAFILEDGGYPAFGAWFVEGINPGLPRLGSIVRTLHNWFDRLVTGTSIGGIGYAMGDIVVGDRSRHTSTLQFMGVDQSTGVMLLNKHGWLDIRWPYQDNLPLYRAILNAGRAFQRAVDAKDFIPMPTWTWPLRKNVTVHALGGCVLADDASRGVTSADPAEFGQVFGYRGLYVADGAIVPTAVGSNPTAAITALSEMVAESLTGIAPDADL
jgi:cholesterol oxidase